MENKAFFVLQNLLEKAEEISKVLYPASPSTQTQLSAEVKGVRDKIDKLQNELTQIIVVGKFNSGKSSLINAMLETTLLPVGMVATTPVITKVMQATEKEVEIAYKSGQKKTVDFDTYYSNFKLHSSRPDSIEDKGNHLLEFEEVYCVTLRAPFQIGGGNVAFIDTPGISENDLRTDLVLNFLPQAHLIVMVIDAKTPLSRDERDFISLLGQPPLESVFFVVNRTDLVEAKHRSELFDSVRNHLKLYFTDTGGKFQEELFNSRIFFVHSEQTKEVEKDPINNVVGAGQPGLDDLVAAIRQFEGREHRMRIGLKSLLLNLFMLSKRIERNIDLWKKSIQKPLEDVEKQYKRLQPKVREMHSNIDYINDRFANFGKNVHIEIYGSLIDYVHEMRNSWEDDVAGLEFAELQSLNIFASNLSEKEKERITAIISKELSRYLELKLVKWAQDAPRRIAHSIEALSSDVAKELEVFNISSDQIIQKLANLETSEPAFNHTIQSALNTSTLNNLILEVMPENRWVDRIVNPIVKDLKAQFQDPLMLNTMGYNLILSLLGAGAALLTGAPGFFLISIGMGVVNTLKNRSESRQFRRAMLEEERTDRSLEGMESEERAAVKRFIQENISKELSNRLFDRLNNSVVAYRDKLSDIIQEEFGFIGNEVANELKKVTDRVQQTLDALANQSTLDAEKLAHDISAVEDLRQSFVARFNEYCDLVFARAFTKADIDAVMDKQDQFISALITGGAPEQPADVPVPFIDEDTEINMLSGEKKGMAKTTIADSIRKATLKSLGVSSSAKVYTSEVEGILDELSDMVGLESVKQRITDLAFFHQDRLERKKQGLPSDVSPSLHLVFTGNPGTGKTTVAGHIGKIYRSIGLLKKGHVVPAGRYNLIGQFVGHTAPQTLEKIEEALDGVLFIDEAYELTPEGNMNDFAHETISLLLSSMEKYKDRLAVIVAGYQKEMERFLDFNIGLRDRFSIENIVHFENFTYEELVTIFQNSLAKSQVSISEPAMEAIREVIRGLSISSVKDPKFANARTIENLKISLLEKRARRRILNRLPIQAPIELDDIPEAYQTLRYLNIMEKNTGAAHLFQNEQREPLKNTEGSKAWKADFELSGQKDLQSNRLRQEHQGGGHNIAGDMHVYNLTERSEQLPKKLTHIPVPIENEPFIGRDSEIKLIHEVFANTQWILLSGFPGIGKTTLAVQYLHQYLHEYQHAIWATCNSTIVKAFAEDQVLLNNLRFSYNSQDDENTRIQLILYEISKIEAKTIVIIDDVKHIHQDELQRLSFPKNIKVLFISNEKIEDIKAIDIKPLEFDRAKALFIHHLGHNHLNISDDVLARLFSEIDFHTMAIRILAKRLAAKSGESSIDLEKEVRLFQSELQHSVSPKNDNKILNLMEAFFGEVAVGEDEKQVLIWFSVLPSSFFTTDDLHYFFGTNVKDLDYTLYSLVNKGFLQQDKELGFKTHQMFLNVAASLYKPNLENCAPLVRAFGNELFNHYQLHLHKNLINKSPWLFPVLRGFVSKIENRSSEFAMIYQNLGILASALGDFEISLKYHRLNLEMCALYRTEKPAEFAYALHYLSDYYNTVGKYSEAATSIQELISFLSTTDFEQKKILQAIAFEDLALNFQKRGGIAESVENFQKSLQIYEETSMSDSIKTAMLKVHLGSALISYGDLDSAQVFLQAASQVFKSAGGEEFRIEQANIFLNLSTSYLLSGKFKLSNQYRKKAHKILIKILPKTHYIFSNVYSIKAQSILGKTITRASEENDHEKFERIHRAKHFQIKAIETLQNSKGVDHLDLATHYFNLARICYCAEELSESKINLKKCLSLLDVNTKPNLRLSITLFLATIEFPNIINVEASIENIKKAIQYLPEHQDYLRNRALYNLFLADKYSDKEDYTEAIKAIEVAYSLYRTIFSDEHPIHVICLHGLAELFQILDKIPEALEKQMEAVAICERNMDDADTDKTTPYINLAYLYVKNGDFERGLFFKQKALLLNDKSDGLSKIENIGTLALIHLPLGGKSGYAHAIIPPGFPLNNPARIKTLPANTILLKQYSSLNEALVDEPKWVQSYGESVHLH